MGDAKSRSLFIGKPFAREVKVAERAEHAHAADRLDRRDFEGFPESSVGSVYHVGASPLPAADGQDVRSDPVPSIKRLFQKTLPHSCNP